MRHEAGWVEKGPLRLDRDGNGGRRFEQENDGPDLRLSRSCTVQGNRRPERRCEFHVRRAVEINRRSSAGHRELILG